MSTTLVEAEVGRIGTWADRARAYAELTKLRLSMMVLLTVLVGGLLASWGQPNPWTIGWTVLGTALVAASASVWNQWLERDQDARMLRTAGRPIPSGRVSGSEAIQAGLLMLASGMAILVTAAGWSAALWGFATWMLYVGVYTPLKSRTSWNTVVGAVSGAMPVVIGWVAAGGGLSPRVVALFLIVFFWQFPHFMAIAWLYRRDYERGGYRMTSVVDPSGRWAGVLAVLGAACLVPTSVILARSLVDFMSLGSALACVIGVFLLGLCQLGMAMAFLWRRDEITARWLLRGSLIYLPAVLSLVAWGPAF